MVDEPQKMEIPLPHLFFAVFQLAEALPFVISLGPHSQGQCYLSFLLYGLGTEAPGRTCPHAQGNVTLNPGHLSIVLFIH